ncbi:Nucleotide binding protein PINc [Pyrolobus fumarii 1A]|uniref:Nucleotide binding protein PINc n=1 Tax=Pyrolobus fumarii (strain DSM 11204 / 1A) TaxID=694429 RepID=G0EF12_PYRF1|nr:NOB1 family endonuclease [Pyrolobus fumarii]AEM38909.1 Nucleotide binding protein PINc [Pyrolobus fumarii 1A]
MTGKVMVLDTTAFLAGLPLMLYGVRLVAPPSVIEEVRDDESRSRLETAMLLERVEVVKPREKYKWRVKRAAVKVGVHGSLSETDVEVAALALQLKEEGLEVEVVTDDYALQNLLASLGVSYRSLRTRGISRLVRYILVCPACGYTSRRYGERRCPVCGAPLVKRPRS